MIDGTKIGQLAAEVMELVEAATPDEGETPSIGIVAVVVEVNVDEETGPGWTNVMYRCSDSRRWGQTGLFEAAIRAVLSGDEDEA